MVGVNMTEKMYFEESAAGMGLPSSCRMTPSMTVKRGTQNDVTNKGMAWEVVTGLSISIVTRDSTREAPYLGSPQNGTKEQHRQAIAFFPALERLSLNYSD